MMNQPKPPENGYRSRTRANVMRLFYWNGAWAAATLLMCFGPEFLWHKAMVFTLLAAGLDIAVGIGMILANKKYVMEQDELQRKVYLNASAITLGVALIAGLPLAVMDAHELIPFHASIALLLILMSLTFVVSNMYGTRRYR